MKGCLQQHTHGVHYDRWGKLIKLKRKIKLTCQEKEEISSIDCSYMCGGRNSKSNNYIMFGSELNLINQEIYIYIRN